MTRRLRLAVAALLVLAGVLTPVASGADSGGNSGDVTAATAQCAQGYTYDSGSGDCEKHETEPAGKSCPATISGHAVQVSGSDCVTTTAHTTLPTYSCDTANAGNPAVRFALVGDPPECQRTVTRQVREQRTVTDMVHFTETYTVRVPSTVTEHESYTVKVRVAPFTKRVRVAPFTRTYTGMETYTYTVRVRYCTKWDVVVGTSACVKHGYRNEQRTGVRETLITEPVYHYEDQPVYNYRDETRYRNVTRTVWRNETRTRQVCCRPVTRTVTVTRTVRDTQTAVPDAACTASGYSLNSSSQCERPAGTRLGGVTYRCTTGWSATSGDPSNCERTLTADPTGWVCETGRTIDRSTSPPHCHPDPDDDGSSGCTIALGTLGAGTVTRSGTWAAGCASAHKSTPQVPYWAQKFAFTVAAAATLDLDATSAGDPHVYITDSDGTVVGSDDDSGTDGRDSRIRGLALQPDTYTVEVTTGGDRSTGSFTLTLKLTTAAGAVTISGFKAAEGTPAVGEAAVTVSSGFTVSPAGATCRATPTGVAVSPSSGAQRTASLSVAAATEATVTVTCTSGAQSAKATAKFKANPAPVRIGGLADASSTAGDAASATVSTEFDVTPADASCTATPAGATVAPATGAKRTVSLKVDKGATVTVTVTCSKNGASHRETAKLTATPFGACTSPLGAFGAAGVTVRGTISAEGNCKSRRRSPVASRTYWARRHVLELPHPSWVTITLQSAVSGSRALDTYLLILEGDAADGSGRRLAHNDDQGRGHPTSRYDSRITDHYLPAGTYTIEATTYAQRRTGNYVLHIDTDLLDDASVIAVPHPDDEIQAWSLIENTPDTYKIFVLMTRGEQTAFCVSPGDDVATGEAAPSPRPTGKWTSSCESARQNSFLDFMNGMAKSDTSIPSSFTYRGAKGPFSSLGHTICRHDKQSCVSDRSARVWTAERGAVIWFNLGDGDLTEDEVTWATRVVRDHRSALGIDASLPIRRLIGASYWNSSHSGCYAYPHADHLAIRDALWKTNFLMGYQAVATCKSDPHANRSGQVTHSHFDDAFRVVGSRRVGHHVVNYGWLFSESPGYWPGDYSGQDELFHRDQEFRVRFGQ